ncbi:MAG: class I SAM-dependent methyltransferase [Steroidobacteraceae bacterium]
MQDQPSGVPDSTAVRVALWRALHLIADAPPHVIDDDLGLRLAAPAEGWRRRPDMDPEGTKPFRASIVARARFIEDLVTERAAHGVDQYVILGAGLDTFAQRRPEVASHMRVFEVDRPGPQAWKRHRLEELGFAVPDWLKLVPADFEARAGGWERLAAAGFDARRPAVVACTGVTLYLTRDAVAGLLRDIAAIAPGSRLALSFILPLELVEPQQRPLMEAAQRGAAAAGTPFLSSFLPQEMIALARAAGFSEARYVSAHALAERYFTGRSDGLRPSNGEELLLAGT